MNCSFQSISEISIGVQWSCTWKTKSFSTMIHSLHNDGEFYTHAVLKYLSMKQNQKDRNNSFDHILWQTIGTSPTDLPHQGYTFHCGAYTCLFAERIAINKNCTNISPTLLNERARWYIMSCISHDKVLQYSIII